MAKRKKRDDIQDAAPSAPPPEPVNGGTVSDYVKFSPKILHRRELKNAPYNPRRMTDTARKKLRKNLEKVGLLEPPVWNKRTGNIVGGHQRISILDSLHGSSDYSLPVAEVDLDEKTEKEQNIFMNNPEAQGDFDMELMGKLFRDDKIDFEAAGFAVSDVYQMFGDNPVIEESAHLEELSDQLKKLKDRSQIVTAKLAARDSQDFYIVVVFANVEMRDVFANALGLPENRFVDGRQLLGLLKPETTDERQAEEKTRSADQEQ